MLGRYLLFLFFSLNGVLFLVVIRCKWIVLMSGVEVFVLFRILD